MKIKSLTFKDKDRNILIDNVEFADLTLFVGASGVGKTQILDAIKVLQDICRDELLKAVSWDVVLQDGDETIRWKGETILKLDNTQQYSTSKNREPIGVQYITEEVSKEGQFVINRNGDSITFGSTPMPKLSNTSSLVYIFNESSLTDIKLFFNRIIEEMNDVDFIFPKGIEIITPPISEKIFLDINLPLSLKIYMSYGKFKNTFNKIQNDFISIFPFVENIDIGKYEYSNLPLDNLTVIINEKGVKKNIFFSQLSSGMQKAFGLLAAIHLAPKGAVLIVDELENCLGINCLDSIVEILQDNDRDMQAIFTSHHPYIINAIPREHWRLVSREGGVIHSDAVADKMSTISKHDAFLQLLQMPAFRDGVRS